MTLVTTDQQLARFAVEMAAGRTGWPSEVIPLEDGWLVRNAHVELGEAEVRQAYAGAAEGEVEKPTCSRCGGEGGEENEEGEFHPCYHCRTVGKCSCDECREWARFRASQDYAPNSLTM